LKTTFVDETKIWLSTAQMDSPIELSDT